ncbi:hypothetical protein GCM10027321_17650 [Massilia terrae]|uniref:Glycoside hydrolase family 55 protein n=1 Tax=Massilia terrae TaxID=1811224 RepID=A0ABT2CW32_9BURK|nr:glycoside hydrolase family 55 protein [Massilia terrae]MCS0658166.1 glycoside hydrolase family 55 protein [Massilia terrae]
MVGMFSKARRSMLFGAGTIAGFFAKTTPSASVPSLISEANAAGQVPLFQNQLSAPSGASLVGFAQVDTTQRTVQDRLRDEINVRDFGAKGDGAADDTDAINAAIAYAKAKRFRCVVVPSGNYKTSGSIVIGGNFQDGFELRGHRASITATANAPVFLVDARHPEAAPEVRIHVLLHGFDVVGPGKAHANSAAIQAQHGANVHAKDCSLKNCNRGLYGYGNLISQYDNLFIQGCAYGIDLAADGEFAPNDVHFTNCQIIANDRAIRAKTFPNGAITFVGCEIEGNNSNGAIDDGVPVAEFANAGKVTMIGCHMEDNPGQFNIYYDALARNHLNLIGSELTPGDRCGNVLYVANVTGGSSLIVVGSRVTNNVGKNQIVLSPGARATIIGETAGYVSGDVSQALILQAGLLNISREDRSVGGVGVAFPRTQQASADPNTLDDYAEGTWTPVVIGAAGAGSAKYSTQNGRYTKVGRQVFVEAYLHWTGGTGTGDFYIAGLPFTVSNSPPTYPSANIGRTTEISWTAGNIIYATFEPGTRQIHLLEGPNGGGGVSMLPYPKEGSIMVSGTYTV